MKLLIQYQDQLGRWRPYQVQHNQTSTYKTAQQRARATNKRHHTVEEMEGCSGKAEVTDEAITLRPTYPDRTQIPMEWNTPAQRLNALHQRAHPPLGPAPY